MSTITQKAKQGLPLDDILIIDCHNHLDYWHNFNIPKCSAEGMLQSMDVLGIDKVFVTAHSSIGPDYYYGNNLVMEAVQKYPDRFLGYVTVNPNYPDDMQNELDRCFAIEGFKGIKLHPAVHGCPIDYKNYHLAYATAQEKRCVVLIHVWGKADVATVDKLAGQYPNAQFIMGHGGADARAMEDAVQVVHKHQNVFIDIAVSFAPQGNIEWLVKEMGSKKILFGSDMPFYDARHTFGRLAMADITDEEKKDIFGLNIKKVLSVGDNI